MAIVLKNSVKTGDNYFDKGDYQNAISSYLEAYQLNKGDPELLDKIKTSFDVCREKAQKLTSDTYVNLAKTFYNIGGTDDAIQVLKYGLNQNPKDEVLNSMLKRYDGTIKKELKGLEDTLKSLNEKRKQKLSNLGLFL